MIKLNKLMLFFTIICGILSAELKIGYIDSQKIMSSFEPVRQVQIKLEKEQRKLENEMNNLMTRLDSLTQDYERQRLLMSENRRSEKEMELRKLDENIQRFQMEKFGPEGEIYRKQNQLLKPVLSSIDEAIQIVGGEQGYDFIFDAMTGALLYALEAHNLTDAVLEELDKLGTVTE